MAWTFAATAFIPFGNLLVFATSRLVVGSRPPLGAPLGPFCQQSSMWTVLYPASAKPSEASASAVDVYRLSSMQSFGWLAQSSWHRKIHHDIHPI